MFSLMVANTLREHLSVGGVEGGFVLPDGFPLADSGVAMGGLRRKRMR